MPKTLQFQAFYPLLAQALSVVAGVVLFFVITLVSHQDPEVAAWAAILSGLGIALLLAFLVPLTMFLYCHILAPIFRSLGGWQQYRHDRLQESKHEQERRRQQAEYERSAPQREQAARERAAAQKRREDARSQCELLYSLHAPDVGQRFPRPLFDDFLKKYMGDERSAEDVEQRSQQLQAIIQQHLQKAGKAQKKMTLAELAQWFLGEKQQIDASPLGPDDKQLLLSQLEERFAKLQEKYIRGVEP